MEQDEMASTGAEFDEKLGLAGVNAAVLVNLLPQLRANPGDDALWEQAVDTLSAMALGLEELGQTLVDHHNELERIKAHLNLP